MQFQQIGSTSHFEIDIIVLFKEKCECWVISRNSDVIWFDNIRLFSLWDGEKSGL